MTATILPHPTSGGGVKHGTKIQKRWREPASGSSSKDYLLTLRQAQKTLRNHGKGPPFCFLNEVTPPFLEKDRVCTVNGHRLSRRVYCHGRNSPSRPTRGGPPLPPAPASTPLHHTPAAVPRLQRCARAAHANLAEEQRRVVAFSPRLLRRAASGLQHMVTPNTGLNMSQCCKTRYFIGTTTTGSSLVHCKLY